MKILKEMGGFVTAAVWSLVVAVAAKLTRGGMALLAGSEEER